MTPSLQTSIQSALLALIPVEGQAAPLREAALSLLDTLGNRSDKTIADLYGQKNMPADLRAAHERNDETLERITIGRRFNNDTERQEKLFELFKKNCRWEGSGWELTLLP